MTGQGGIPDYGTVFKLNIDGTGYTVLKQFTNGTGAYAPNALALSGNVL